MLSTLTGNVDSYELIGHLWESTTTKNDYDRRIGKKDNNID